jgi:hypothetical protein
MRTYLVDLLKNNRRPVVLATLSIVLLLSYFVLIRAMAHGHVAHVLLGGGADSGAIALAVIFVVVRFITVILVPGLMLAAFAEIAAYVLVGPRRDAPEDELQPESDG